MTICMWGIKWYHVFNFSVWYLAHILLDVNGKQSVTLCLVFRLFKRCLNKVKRSKQFGIVT